MKQRNRWPKNARERLLAERIVQARDVADLAPEYRNPHADELCDPMTGFCASMSSALFHATGGYRGPYALMRIGRQAMAEHGLGDDTHYFLADRRLMPGAMAVGLKSADITEIFKRLDHPERVVVDLTASQFDGAIPYHLGRGAALKQVKGGDVEPTDKVLGVLERAGLLHPRRRG